MIEEIEQCAETLLLLLTDAYTPDEKRRTVNVLRHVATQAYERAALVADEVGADEVAEGIRALKDSLQPE